MHNVDDLWKTCGKDSAQTTGHIHRQTTDKQKETKTESLSTVLPHLKHKPIHCDNYQNRSVEQTFYTESTGPITTTTIKYIRR